MTKIAVLGELDSKVRADLILKKDAVRANEERISVDFGRITQIVSPLDLDLAYIAAGLFACENLQRNGKIQLNEWIRFVVREKTAWDTDNVKSLLQAIISFTLNEQPSISLNQDCQSVSLAYSPSSFPHHLIFAGPC